jgi:tRNA threonylcarbamoyladenosine biosynthesis protein TsaB
MMSHYLALQSTYADVECALFRGTSFVEAIRIGKTESSSLMLIAIQELLSKHKISFQSLDFLAVNSGPGPFTTLRVVIATVNGLSFAGGIPLIGVDGLKVFLGEYHKQGTPTIALLNAFGGDLYFGIQVDGIVETGFEQAAILLPKLAQRFGNQPIQLIGNGIAHHQKLVDTLLKPHASIIQVDTPSIEAVGRAGFARWQSDDRGCQQLMPEYLKQAIGIKP